MRTFWMIVFLSGLSLALYFLYRDQTTGEEPQALREVLLPVEDEAIEKIRFRNYVRGGGTVEVVRDDEGWRMTSPFLDRAEALKFDKLVQIVTGFDRLEVHEAGGTTDEDMGLGKDLKASLTFEGSFGTTTFEIGLMLAGFGDNHLIRRRGFPEKNDFGIYRFPPTLFNAINDVPYHFRQQTLSPARLEELRFITVERPGGQRLELKWHPTGWRVEAPFRGPLRAARGLLARLARVRIGQVLFGERSRSTQELDYDPVELRFTPPAYLLTFGVDDERKRSIEIGISEMEYMGEVETNAKPRWYARLPGELRVFGVDETSIERLVAPWPDLRERTLFTELGAPIEKLVVRGSRGEVQGPSVRIGAGEAFTIEKRDDRYAMRAGDREHRADGAVLQAFSDHLRRFEVDSFEERLGVPEWEAAGRLEVTAAGETMALRIRAGENGKHKIDFGDAHLLASLASDQIDALLPPFVRFLDRRLSPHAVGDCVSLRVLRRGETLFEVHRDGEAWKQDGQRIEPRRERHVRALLNLRCRLRSLSRRAPASFEHELRITTRDGSVHSIGFTPVDSGRIWAFSGESIGGWMLPRDLIPLLSTS